MKEIFVSYELALALKEINFDEACLFMYSDGKDPYTRGSFGNLWQNNDKGLLVAPMFTEAFRWFREEHILHHTIIYADPAKAIEGEPDFSCMVFEPHGATHHLVGPFASYWEAEEACIIKAIDFVKRKV
jgi:hypothetical protein